MDIIDTTVEATPHRRGQESTGEDPFETEEEVEDCSFHVKQFIESMFRLCRSIPLKETLWMWRKSWSNVAQVGFSRRFRKAFLRACHKGNGAGALAVGEGTLPVLCD
jgi:hypothetical protein